MGISETIIRVDDQMKSLSIKLGGILIGLSVFTCAEVWGEDWKYLGEAMDGTFFYDATSITRPSENIVRVWVKLSYNEDGILEMVRKHGPKYKELSYALVSWEIDCSNKRYRISLEIFYSQKAGFLSSDTTGKFSERDFSPESVSDFLSKAVCK